MILFINSLDSKKAILKINQKSVEFPSTIDRKQQILLQLDDFLVKNSLKLSQISEIQVATGTGSFTGQRMGVAIGNALAQSLAIAISEVRQGILLGRKDTILPFYDHSANISQKR